MGFGSRLSNALNGFSSGFTQGLFGTDTVKDYKHASKTFVSDGLALAPQQKFLFHVYFNLNTSIPGLSESLGSAQDLSQLGMMVRTADVPSYRIDVDELNQYNRKRYIQKKINYQPVNITFHDDGSDLVRSMWYNYYVYYFSDARHGYDGVSTGQAGNGPFDFNRRDVYDDLRSVHDWGYNGESPSGGYKPNFFRDIKIYGLNRGNFVQYTLINPVIVDWRSDTFDYSQDSGTMTNTMTLQYETVKFSRGRIGTPGSSEVRGWGQNESYDSSPSKLSQGGGTQSVLGQGGLLDAGTSILNDLQNGNILGAIVTAGRSYTTFKDADVGDIAASEILQQGTALATTALTSRSVQNSLNNFLFTKPDEGIQNFPPGSATVQSNNKLSSATNWQNPNLTPSSGSAYNTAANDVQSNGISTNRLPPTTS